MNSKWQNGWKAAPLLGFAAFLVGCAHTQMLAPPAKTAVSAPAPKAAFLTPTANFLIEGIPPIPADLPARVEAYTAFKPSTLVTWQPGKSAMLVRMRHTNSNQLFLVDEPGAKPKLLTDFPDAVAGGTFQPKAGGYILFQKAAGGDEVFRIYRMDLATRAVTAISPENERASAPSWSRDGSKIVFTTSTIDRATRATGAARKAETRFYVADPTNPAATKLVATLDGGGWFGARLMAGEKKLSFTEYVSANESYIWSLDLASGKKTRLTPEPKTGAPTVSYGAPRFTRDGKGFFTTSDRDSEFKRLVFIDLASGTETPLTAHLAYDVEDVAVSVAAKRIAFTTNENGSSVLRMLDLETKKELPRPALIPGEISNLRWKGAQDDDDDEGGAELAFNLTSARAAGEVFSYNLATTKLTRWTNGSASGLNPMDFVEPKLVQWKSFDGLGISGFLYAPNPEKFAGKRPVIINIHGGPEAQSRPGFIGRSNYMVNELGIAVIYPNVRGSSGFGKSFLAADNGFKREDSVKDIGALFDWIKDQPNLDASKVLVMGGSYGGYMALAVSTNYADRIAGGISSVGISNFVTFLTNTETYRRDLRRVEYGDERDPAMRAHLEKISPLNNAAKIKKPLFVVQGKNDPRVPYTESVQIVEQLKKQNTPVWFLMADDEGHGFAKKSNQDFLFYSQIKFLESTLLR